MRVWLSIFLLGSSFFFSLKSQANVFCAEHFQLNSELSVISVEGLSREIEPFVTNKTPVELEALIMEVARGDRNYEGFSATVNSALRNSLDIFVQSEMLTSLLMETVYKELDTRESGKPRGENWERNFRLTKERVFQFFDIEIPDFPVSLVQNLERVRFSAYAQGYVAQVVRQFSAKRKNTEPHIDMPFDINSEKLLESDVLTERSMKEALQLGDGFSEVAPELVVPLFRTLVREQIIREQVEILAEQGLLNWTSHRQSQDQYILFLAVYPELLPLVREIPNLGIQYGFSPVNDYYTNYSTYGKYKGDESLWTVLALRREESDFESAQAKNYNEELAIQFIITTDFLDYGNQAIVGAQKEAVEKALGNQFLQYSKSKRGKFELKMNSGRDGLEVEVWSTDQGKLAPAETAEFFMFVSGAERYDENGNTFVSGVN